MRAIGYVRISQPDENPENQEEAIREYAKRKGYEFLGVFSEKPGTSGAVPPREREVYRSMLEFAKANGVKVIIFYDLSRLSRSLEDGLLELKRLADEGYTIKFASQEFLDYIDDPMLLKKVVSDFLWFAEMYREDVRRRTKNALYVLKKQGKLFHRPTLLHYLALYLSGKRDLKELSQEDLELAKRSLRKYLEDFKRGVPIRRLWRRFNEEYRDVWKHASECGYSPRRLPKGYKAFYNVLKRILEEG